MNFVGRSFTKYDSAKNSISLSIRSNILGTAFKIFKASNTCCRPAPSHPLWSWGSWRQVKLIWPWAPRWAPTFSTSWSLGDRWTLVTCGENLGLLENSWDNFNRNALPIYIYNYIYIYIPIYIYLMVKTVKTMVSGEDFWKTNPLINAKKNRDVVFRTRGGPTSSVVDQACNRVE